MVSEILMDRNVTFCILLHKQFINVIKTFIVCQILTDFCVDNVNSSFKIFKDSIFFDFANINLFYSIFVN